MAEFERSLGLDVGNVRIGVALSDPLGIIAQPHQVIQCEGHEKDVETVRQIVEETGAVRIVVGIPLNREGQHGPQADKTMVFVKLLRDALDVEIVLQDERFSTAAAQKMLIQANVRRKKRKKVVDKIAATHILQVFLDRAANARQRGGQ